MARPLRALRTDAAYPSPQVTLGEVPARDGCVFSHARVSATPRSVAHQVPLSMGFSRQEYSSRLPFPPPGHLPNPVIEPASLVSPALAGGFFLAAPPGSPGWAVESLLASGPRKTVESLLGTGRRKNSLKSTKVQHLPAVLSVGASGLLLGVRREGGSNLAAQVNVP